MEPIPVTATELRTRARELIERAHYYNECFRVENFGRPMAVIISCQEFNELQALLKEHSRALSTLRPANGNKLSTVRRPRKKP